LLWVYLIILWVITVVIFLVFNYGANQNRENDDNEQIEYLSKYSEKKSKSK